MARMLLVLCERAQRRGGDARFQGKDTAGTGARLLGYDAACLRDGRPPAAFATIGQPVLVATAAASSSSRLGARSRRACRTRSGW